MSGPCGADMVLTLTILGVLAIVALTLISAFFSSSELAIFSVSSHRVDALVAEGYPGAKALAKLREEPRSFLVTALVSNNVANIAAASVATAVFIQFLPAGQAATISTAATSFFVIVFGEIAPKSYAVTNAEKHALRVARPVRVVQRLLWPIFWIFEATTALVNKVTGGGENIETYVTREEIVTIVESGESSGALGIDEGAMIRGVLDLEQTRIRGIMVPRSKMVIAPESASVDELLETCWRESVSRIPLYRENRDDITGVVEVRDLLRARAEGLDVSEIVTRIRYVPGIKPVDELLTEMQVEGHRMVLVVDEFGTIIGLATLEDAVEEIVGEIFDRDETDPIRVVDDDTAVANGWATVQYVNETLGVDIHSDGPFETMAGLVNHHLGRLAEEGEQVELGNATVTVLDASERRVRRVRIDWQSRGSQQTETESSG